MTAPLTHRLDDAGRAALREVAPEIVMEFRGEHNRETVDAEGNAMGSQGLDCPAGRVKGLWYDHEIGRGGDIIRFIELERGCSFVDALDHAAQYVSELRNGHHSSRPASRPAPRQTVDDDGDDEKRITQALTIWCEARPLTGTIAEKYLRSRCIEAPNRGARGSEISSALSLGDRNAPRDGGAGPRHHHRRTLAIHRTAFTVDGRKLDRPKLLGPSAGGAIKLLQRRHQ